MAIVANRKYTIAGLALLVIWFWAVLSPETSPRRFIPSSSYYPWSSSSSSALDAFDFPPVSSQAIRSVCASTKWNSSLVFTCDNNHGGVSRVRNSILNCVRYAIGAGGALVLPNIALRDTGDEMGHDEAEHAHVHRRHGWGRRGLEYMFDMNHFADSLRESCPELVLIRHMEQTTGARRRGLLPESLFGNLPTSGLEEPGEWPRKLQAWIEEHMAPQPQAEPLIIDLEQSFLHYPTHADGHAFAHTFGSILKFRQDARILATKTLNAMKDWYKFPANITERLMSPSFLGAHLGTENPFLEQKRHEVDIVYSHYDTQLSAYLQQAIQSKIPLVYMASGNLAEIHKAGLDAMEFNIEITHKEDLLKGKDLEELEKLRYDQRALVDWLVLMKGQQFAGVGHSPFSWNIALQREQLAGHHEGKLDGEIWEDGLSKLYGVVPDYIESSACMWS